MTLREQLISGFNESAAMEGNEPHFIALLDAYDLEWQIRLDDAVIDAKDASYFQGYNHGLVDGERGY